MRREFGTIQELERGKLYRVFWQEGGRKRSHRVRGTRADASRFLASVQVRGEGATEDVTYSEYWAAVVEPSLANLSPKTVSDYRACWAILAPMIGDAPIAKTTYRAAQAAIDRIDAPRTQEKCKALWRKICNMAASQDGILQGNPVAGVKTKPVSKREKALWSVEGAKSALDGVRGTKYEPLVLLSLSCGLRPEECYALDWDDLSFSDSYCTVNICKTVVLVDGKPVERDKTKTKGSRRKSVCGGMFAARLEELSHGKSGAICAALDGRRSSPSTIAHNWKFWCGRHNIEYVSFENLRSNYKTLAAQAMIPAELVRMQMGHAGVGVAEQHYLVANEQLLRMTADMFCKLFV